MRLTIKPRTCAKMHRYHVGMVGKRLCAIWRVQSDLNGILHVRCNGQLQLELLLPAFVGGQPSGPYPARSLCLRARPAQQTRELRTGGAERCRKAAQLLPRSERVVLGCAELSYELARILGVCAAIAPSASTARC